LVLSGNLTLTEVAPFVNQIRDLLKLCINLWSVRPIWHVLLNLH
jgi:hypothetical protein